MWYVLNGDRDYWERVYTDDWNTAFLHISSEDKSLVLTVPLSAAVPYAVSKGRIFQGKPSSGKWKWYSLPFEIPESVTPRFVAEIIGWAESDGSTVEVQENGRDGLL